MIRKRKNLLNVKIYNLLVYFDFFRNRSENPKVIKEKIQKILNNIYSIETLAKYLEVKRKKCNNKKICNEIKNVIEDLEDLKWKLNDKNEGE